MKNFFNKNKDKFIILTIFLSVSFFTFFLTGRPFYLFDLPYIGFSLFTGLMLYTYLPKDKKQIGRRVAQLLIGFYFLFFLSLVMKVNMQIEGFFFQVGTLFFGGAFIHYSIAKLFGPLYFGRGFCGWACWNAMLFDWLPWKNSAGRIRYLGMIRYVHFFVVLFLVGFLIFKFHIDVKTGTLSSVFWFIVGNAIYYFIGLVSAFWLRDNRAFCKYFCPIPPLQKILGRFSVLKVAIDNHVCSQCGKCEKKCPMDIKILDYKKLGLRVQSTECILCNACVEACPNSALKLRMGFDVARQECLSFRSLISTSPPRPKSRPLKSGQKRT